MNTNDYQPNIYDFNNSRDWLQAVLDFRVKKNPKYSLRALARQLEMSPTTLSRILSGKRSMGQETANHLARFLRLSDQEKIFLIFLIDSSLLVAAISKLKYQIKDGDLNQSEFLEKVHKNIFEQLGI